MKTTRCCRRSSSSASRPAPGRRKSLAGSTPRCSRSRHGLLADLSRRLLRPPLQHAQPDQRGQRQGPEPGLDLSRQHLAPGRDRSGGEGPDTPPPGSGGFGLDIKSTPLLVNGVLYLTAPDNVWAVDPRTGREHLALLLEDARRHPHRQPRRGHVRELALLPDPGQLLRLPRRRHGQGALAQGDRERQARVLLDGGAHRDPQPRHHRRGRRLARRARATSSRAIPRRASCSGAGTRPRGRASRARRPGPTSTRWSTAAACRGCPAATIRS